MKEFLFTVPLTLLSFVVVANNASAGLIRTDYQGANNNQLAFAGNVSSTDLINQGRTTFSSATQTGYNADPGAGQASVVLNDGTLGAPSGNLAFPDGALAAPPYSVTYNLNLSTAAAGYNLTTIRSFTAHVDNRSSQGYTVSVDFVGDGLGNFVNLGNFTGANIGGTNQTSMMTLQNDVGSGTTAFASGVGAIRFSIFNTGDAAPVYREFDVFGTTAVPEPSSMLLTLGAGAFVYYRHRRGRKMAAVKSEIV